MVLNFIELRNIRTSCTQFDQVHLLSNIKILEIKNRNFKAGQLIVKNIRVIILLAKTLRIILIIVN